MKKEVTFRQMAYLFLLVSLSPILRQIPNAVAQESGRSGYIAVLWSLIVILPLTGLILYMIKKFPGLNIYEIMKELVGVVLAKIIILGYLIWIFISLVIKVSMYSHTLQFTLMTKTRADVFYVVLILLVFYALAKGVKTVFRFAEFSLNTLLLILVIIFICAIPSIRSDYLLPVSTVNIKSTVVASKNVVALGGNIIIALFFADRYRIHVTKPQKRTFWFAAVAFVVIAFLITYFTLGITGAELTTVLPFPFYTTVKSISLFNIFERFEVVITLICILSDFIAVCMYSILLIRCIYWIFNLQDYGYLAVPLTVIIYYTTFYMSSTQFEINFFYRSIVIYLNIIFQYIIPVVLGLFLLIKRKKIVQQF